VRDGTYLLLASNSPRRRELLALGNWTISQYVPNIDEMQQSGETPTGYVRRLAETKARAAAAHVARQRYVVAADTAVVDGGDLLGKPAGAAEATEMLRRLRGHTHQVYTGIALQDVETDRVLTDVCVTTVPMRSYSDGEIQRYVRTGDPLDKAGAYAIQHGGFRPVEAFQGCYASVMGLPLCHLLRLFEQLGTAADPQIPAKCQNHLNYACPVSSAILRGEPAG
jgi:septum formation protein